MKKFLLTSFIITLSSTSAFAQNVCESKYGTLTCGAGIVDKVSYTGFVNMDGTTVTNVFDVLGQSTVVNSHLNTLQMKGDSRFARTDVKGNVQIIGNVNIDDVQMEADAKITGDAIVKRMMLAGMAHITGTIECDYCTFKSDTTVTGEITTEKSAFLRTLTISVRKATFANTKLTDIYVKKPNDNEEQTVYLRNDSSVRNITFEGQKGVVILSGNSVVTGAVQGGKVVKN